MRDVIIPTDATARFNTAVDAVVDAGRGTSGFILAHGQAGRGKSARNGGGKRQKTRMRSIPGHEAL